HRGFRGTLVAVALDLVLLLRRPLAVGGRLGGLPGATRGRTADIADAFGGLDVADRTVNRFVPRLVRRLLAKTPHHAASRTPPSGPIPTFASLCNAHISECWNRKTTSKYLILVELWI